MERISRSWELLKSSWSVLRADKELVVYPVVSAVAGIVAAVIFLGAWLVTGGLDRADGDSLGIVDLVVFFVFYLVASTVVIFFNAALIAAANIRLEGGDPTLGDGFRIALRRLPAIIVWAAITATVGLVLRAIAERGGAVGAIVSIIGGMAWGLVTYLVVPVLVVEGVGPVEALKRSASLLRRTWGEQVVGNFSIGLIIGLAFVVVAIAGGVLVGRARECRGSARHRGGCRAGGSAHRAGAHRRGPFGHLQHRPVPLRERPGLRRLLPAGDARPAHSARARTGRRCSGGPLRMPGPRSP